MGQRKGRILKRLNPHCPEISIIYSPSNFIEYPNKATKISEPSTMAEENGTLPQFSASRKSSGTNFWKSTITMATMTSDANVTIFAYF